MHAVVVGAPRCLYGVKNVGIDIIQSVYYILQGNKLLLLLFSETRLLYSINNKMAFGNISRVQGSAPGSATPGNKLGFYFAVRVLRAHACDIYISIMSILLFNIIKFCLFLLIFNNNNNTKNK